MPEVIGGLIMAIVITLCTWGANVYSCASRWEDSGYKSKYQILAGCKISKDGGKTYIPERTQRDVQ